MIGDVADAFMAHVAGNRAVIASEDVQIGTGLARPDVYDWPAAIAADLQTGAAQRGGRDVRRQR